MIPSVDFQREGELLVCRRLGLSLPKERQADLQAALGEGLRSSRLSSPEEYLAWLRTMPDDSAEWERIAARLTVGETYFFRDLACFEALEQHVLPELIAAKRSLGLLRLRLWSAGCSTGEEAYSLAILLDRLLPDRAQWALTVLATDLNRRSLDTAHGAVYRKWSMREIPAPLQNRYFHSPRAGIFELEPRIRRMVTFTPLNLAEDAYPSIVTNTTAMDLILCRNVIMYFSEEAQRDCVARLQRSLLEGGWLILSPVEASPDLLRPLTPVGFKGAVLYRKADPHDAATPSWDWRPTDGPSPAAPPALTPAARPEEGRKDPPPLHEESPLARARALADQGKLEAARQACEAAVAQDRLDPESHLLLAAICQELGDTPAALEGLRRSIYLAPDCAPAHFLQGTLLLREGVRARGRRSLRTAILLLESMPSDQTVEGSGGLTAGRLRAAARTYLGEDDGRAV